MNQSEKEQKERDEIARKFKEIRKALEAQKSNACKKAAELN